jgi:hypothetical protein
MFTDYFWYANGTHAVRMWYACGARCGAQRCAVRCAAVWRTLPEMGTSVIFEVWRQPARLSLLSYSFTANFFIAQSVFLLVL